MKKILIAASAIFSGVTPLFSQTPIINFNARSLVVLSDVDMSASTFSDGFLLRDATVKDKLTSIRFPIERLGSVQSIQVSNSAITPKGIVLPSNGELAFLIDSYRSPSDTVTNLKSPELFPIGQNTIVVDLVDPAKPKLKFAFPIALNPLSIDLYKSEVMISAAQVGKKLNYFEMDSEGKPTRLINFQIDIDSTENLVDISYAPSGDFLIASLAPSGELVTFKLVRESNGKLKNIEPVGKPVKLGNNLTFGHFSTDGKKYFIIDSKDNLGKGSSEAELLAINIDAESGDHKVGGKLAIGTNAGAFAISPDGSLIAVASAGNGLGAWTGADAGQGGKVTLVKVGADGSLTKAGEAPVGGILPLSLVFDKDGSNLAVSVFEYFEFGEKKGAVEFFNVTQGDSPSLTPQKAKIKVERGAHKLSVVY